MMDKVPPKRNQAGQFLVITLSAGGLSGVAAMIGLGPLAGLQILANQGDPAVPIEARTLFTPVPVVTQQVDVYDPALPAPRAVAPAPHPPAGTPVPKPAQPVPTATPVPVASATPTPQRTPRPTPTPTLRSTPTPTPPGGD